MTFLGGLLAQLPPQSSIAEPVVEPTPAAVPPLTSTAEGWSSFSHWTKDAAGQVTTRLFPAPAFRKTASGWKPIDPAVAPSSDAQFVGSAETALRPVRFGRHASRLVEVALDDGPVTISSPDLSVGEARLQDRGVDYANVAPDTDLRYRVGPAGVTKELVLRSPSAPRQFRFHLADPSGQLGAAESSPGGGFRFAATIDSDVAVELAAPFAYEQAAIVGEVLAMSPVPVDPTSAHLALTKAGDGFDVTISVDEAWLLGKRFPVVLDPTIRFSQQAGTMLAGSALRSRKCPPLGNCRVNTTTSDVSVGNYDELAFDATPARSAFRFDLRSIPAGSSVTAATLGLYTVGCLGRSTYYCDRNNYNVELRQLNGAWDDSTTFDRLAALTDPGVFSSYYQPAFSIYANCVGCFWMYLNMRAKVQDWVSSKVPNHGFVAKVSSEVGNIGGPFWDYLGPFGPGNPANYPYLEVTYTADNIPTTAEKLGAGLGCQKNQCDEGRPVNTATGNFWHTFSDLAVPGRGPGLDLNRTYNTLDAAYDGPFGYGWSSSYTMGLSVDAQSGAATVRQEDGSQLTFASSGGAYVAPPRVLATLVKNPDGTYTFTRRARERFVFSSAGQLTRVVDLNGYATALSYSGGQLTTVTDPAGRALVFSYGANAKVASVTDPANRRVSYGYDGANNLVSVTDVAGGVTRFGYDTARRMLTMTDPRGGVTTNTYDASSRVVTQDDPMGRRTRFDYTTTPGATRITHPRGNVEIQAYTNGVLTAVTKGAGSAEAATWRYAYEHATLASTSVTDPNGNTTTSTYDLAGNLTSSTDGLGRTSRFTYDTLNDVTSATDPLGITTTFTYDAKGNLLSRSRPLTSTSQAQVVRFGYDPARPGDVTSVTDPNGAVWRFSYDAQGNLTRSTDPLGNATTHGYDGIGRKTSSVAPKGNAAGANPATYTTRYAYDAFGDMTSITDPLGNSTAMAYDPNRNLVRHTDANGRATAFAFNAADERTGVTRADNTTLGSGYDGNGNLVRQTDGGGRSTTYTYDAQDRLKTMADPLGRTTSYSYDGAGNRTSLTDPQGQVTTFAYDAADQLTDILYSSDGTPDVFFAYDDNGRRVQMSDGTGTKGVGINLYAYDSLNRLVQHVNGNGQVVRYGYDLKGQLSTLTYPNGLSVTRAFDAAGRMTSVSDWLGNTTTFAYDPNANLTTTKFPVPGADYRDTFTYDAADQLMGVTDTADGFVYANFGYTRDNLGQLTSVSPTGTSQGPETYGYTALNQLASVNGAPYSYDAADNLTRLASGATQSYDAANQLTSLVDPAAGTTTFGYDQRGNRTSTTDAAGNQTFYSYDQANRLDFWDSGALTLYPFGRRITTFADYSYDGDGLRSMKKQGGAPEAVQLFAWNMAEGLPTLLTDGTASYIYGPDGLPLEQIGADSAASFFHHDQLGSTRLLTDPAGIILADFDYDAYGQLTDSRGLALTPFGFAGEYTDAETGFQYLRARYYDPATGQFVTRDPITAITRDPYRYGSGNPINSIDPTGLYNAETGWCNRIQAIKHPSRIHRCKLVKRLADEATAETEDRYPESLADGQGDAFRHCMWSATMTVFLGPRDAKGFGDRHERANLQEGGSKKSSKMDQFNNRIGRRIGREAEANSPCRNAAVAAAIRRCHAAAAMGGELRLKP